MNNENYIHKISNKRSYLLPDGKILTIPGGEKWSLEEDKLNQIGFSVNERPMSFSPDGTIMVTSSFGEIRLWNLLSADIIAEYRKGEKTIEGYYSICFNHNGKQLLCLDNNGCLHIFDYYPLGYYLSRVRKRFEGRQLTSDERKRFYLE